MTIDLSAAYDFSVLEQPLVDDHYYFVLTNNNFLFGQDWMCSIEFTEPIITPIQEPTPINPVEADKVSVSKVTENSSTILIPTLLTRLSASEERGIPVPIVRSFSTIWMGMLFLPLHHIFLSIC